MIIYPHWWQDDGTCDLDCREWKGPQVTGYDVDDDVIAEYQRASAAWDAARKSLRVAIDGASPLPAATGGGNGGIRDY